MKKPIFIFSLALVLLLPWQSWAQSSIIPCGTDEMMAELRSQNPAEFDRYEAITESAYVEYMTDESNLAVSRANCDLFMIPVVFHIIHDNGPSNIADPKIISQITATNNHYRRMPGTNAFGVGVDTRIQFALATKDPQGNPHSGITRHFSPALTDHNRSDEYDDLINLIHWPGYLNCYVVSDITGGSQSGVIGYAPFPNNNTMNRGVVIRYGFLGTQAPLASGNYPNGTSFSHEAGHWMGLRHPFGTAVGADGCSGGDSNSCLTSGDLVCDTPPAFEATFNCNLNLNSCEETPCDVPDMKELYMGYYEGVCQNAFTQGQADRMHFFLNSDVELSNIISPANQTATGIDNVLPLASEPIVDFTTDKFNTCLNSAVSFSTESIGCITSWNWTFPGATPSTSTDPNPTVQYNIAGTFPVILQVSNGTNSVTISKNSYIKVEDAGSLLPLNESFESSSFPPPGWRVVDFEEDGGWERKTLIASEGSASLSFPAFDAISCNSDDDLISPLLDLTNIYTASLSFDFAYKPASLDQNEGDALLVQVLDACGQTFPGALFDRNGFFLASEIGFEETAAYSPAGPASWQNFTASLDNYAGSRIYLRFRFSSKQGQNFFLDNIRINGINTALEPLRDLEAATQVLPNPFTQGFDLNIQLPFTESIKLEIVDLQGKSLYRRDLGKLPSGAHRFDLSDGAISQLAAGVYFLNLETPTGRASKKIMKL